MDFQTYHTHEYGEKGYKLNLFHIEVVFIIVSITCLPAPPCLGRFNLSLWKQKRHGESNLSPIPVFRPSHCPCARISNAASPRQAIIYTAIGYTLLYIATTEHITCPRRRLPLHYQLCTDSKLRSLNTQNSNVRQTPFSSLACPTSGMVASEGFPIFTLARPAP